MKELPFVGRALAGKCLTALTAVALALGGMMAASQPARAQNIDAGSVVAGLAALAVLGTVLNDDDDRDQRRHAAPPPRPRHHYAPPPPKRYAPPPHARRHAAPPPRHAFRGHPPHPRDFRGQPHQRPRPHEARGRF